jgi:DNA invertase Pin-like site-specific DNA recombinase
MPMNPKVYGYIRFSSDDQKRGDSPERQRKEIETYAGQHGLSIEYVYQDLAVSGHHGRHVREGELGQFIEAVEANQILPGSYLIAENMDRLGRDDPWEAMYRIRDIVKRGINVVTTHDQQIYKVDNIAELQQMFVLMFQASTAHDFSAKLSKRIRGVWDRKRERIKAGKTTVSKVPGWLKIEGTGDDAKFVTIPERVSVVRRIFQMALTGQANSAIARTLNHEGVPGLGGKGWYGQTIAYLLSNPAVIGVFQPHVLVYDKNTKSRREPSGESIENYYPAIIEKSDFNSLQRAPKRTSGKAGRPLNNLLSGLVLCGSCGAPMHLRLKGAGRPAYLSCSNSRRGNGCDNRQIKYELILSALMASLEARDLDLPGLLAGPDAKTRSQEIAYLLDAIAGEKENLAATTDNLIDVLSRQPSAAIETRLAETENRIKEIEQQKLDLETERGKLDNGDDPLRDTLQTWSQVRQMLGHEGSGDLRIRFNTALKRLIKSVEIGKISNTKYKSNKSLWSNFQKWQDPLGAVTVPLTINFQTNNRHLLIYSYPKDSKRYLSLGIRANDTGEIEIMRLGTDPITKLMPEIRDLL